MKSKQTDFVILTERSGVEGPAVFPEQQGSPKISTSFDFAQDDNLIFSNSLRLRF